MPDKPQRELRSGRIRVSIWKNTAAKGDYYSVNLTRLYKDKDGKWQRTESFKAQDLLDIAALCQRAHQLLRIEESKPSEHYPTWAKDMRIKGHAKA